MIIAMTEIEKKELAFFNYHARRMIPYLAYQKIDKTNSTEIKEWNNRLILLGAVDAPRASVLPSPVPAKKAPAPIKTQGLIPGKEFMGPGVSLR